MLCRSLGRGRATELLQQDPTLPGPSQIAEHRGPPPCRTPGSGACIERKKRQVVTQGAQPLLLVVSVRASHTPKKDLQEGTEAVSDSCVSTSI